MDPASEAGAAVSLRPASLLAGLRRPGHRILELLPSAGGILYLFRLGY